jgi:putative ABC transport system permease protein
VIPAVRLGVRLAWGGTWEQRLRAASVSCAVAVGAVVLLAMAGVASSEAAQWPDVYADPDSRRLFAAVVAAVCLPVMVLAATVGRLSAGLRDRRMANLRLLGLGRGNVRLAVAVETGLGAAAGAILGALAYLPIRPVIGSIQVADRRWPPSTLWPPMWAYPAVILGLTVVVVAVSALPQRLDMAATLRRARRADDNRPRWWRVVPLSVGIAACVFVIGSDSTRGVTTPVVVALFGGVSLLGLGLILLVPTFVRLLADAILRLTQRPTLTIAARRLQAQPAGVSRVISGLLLGLFLVVGARSVVVAFEDTPQYRSASDQIRHGQRVVISVDSAHIDQVSRQAAGVLGVRRVTPFPMLGTSCTGTGPCVSAVVGTCQQLHDIAPQIAGCVEGQPFAISPSWDTEHPPTLVPPLHALHQGVPIRGLPGLDGVAIPTRTAAVTAATDVGLSPIDPMGGNLLLPPNTPGLAPLLRVTDRSIFVQGPPGRTLTDQLDRIGGGSISVPDFGAYDFVARLRALVWAVATIILSVGLLTFGIAAIDRAVTRRREVTALQLAGVPRRLLRRTQQIEAALPLALGSTLAIGFGLLAGATYLSLNEGHHRLPTTPALVLAGIAIAGSILIGTLTVIASCPRISPDLIRNE